MGTINYKNAELNAPWWWKRLESALVFFLTGMIPVTGLSKSLTPDMTHDITLVVLPGMIIACKAFGIFFGESIKMADIDISKIQHEQKEIVDEKEKP